MPPTLKEQVEQRCRELWKVYFEGSGWKSIDYPSNQGQKISMERLAKHVIASELKAKIDERKNVEIGFRTQRIKELQDQLSALEKL